MGMERLLTVSELFSLARIRHYSPRLGRTAEPRLAPRSGNFTPPRISPSCPHCVNCGWAGVPLLTSEVMAKQLAKAAFGWMDPLGTLIGRHLRKAKILSAGGLGASSASLVPFMGSLADVIQLPDMDFSKNE